MKTFLKEIKGIRKGLKGDRSKFWDKNKRNFENNIKRIIKKSQLPKNWKIYVVASHFLSDKKIWPFDWDSWSNALLNTATKRQGFQIMIFFNRARAEFLSLPALIHLVVHELNHAKQIAKSPKYYVSGATNDKIARKLEQNAEEDCKKLSDEFRKETALENILYCYDFGGWKLAQKMADFLYNEREEIYAGGYSKEMIKEEYEIFLRAKKKKDIGLFINFFN